MTPPLPPATHPYLWTRDGHLSPLALERLHAADLPPAACADADAHLRACGQCGAALTALSRDDAAHPLPPLRLAPAAPLAAAAGSSPSAPSHAPPQRNKWGSAQWGPVSAALALAAAALLALWAGWPSDPSPSTPSAPSAPSPTALAVAPLDSAPDEVRLKGAAFSLEVFADSAHADGLARRLGDGDPVVGGERLGFRVMARDGGYLLIVGLDAQGSDYLCFPQRNDAQAAAIQATTQPVALTEAVRLDEVLGHERIVGVLCAEPFALSDVRGALAGADPSLPLPPLRAGCAQQQVSLRKVPRADAPRP